MADFSQFVVVTYERKPGHWRAAITRKAHTGSVVDGAKVRSIVTPDDHASEPEAKAAAEKLIRRL
jgi:hypothetical protein